MLREYGWPARPAGTTLANSLGAIVRCGNLLPRAATDEGRPMRPVRPQLTGGWCDGPLGMAREAKADALVAKWRQGNLVCEEADEPRAAAGVVARFAKCPPSKPICLCILA